MCDGQPQCFGTDILAQTKFGYRWHSSRAEAVNNEVFDLEFFDF